MANGQDVADNRIEEVFSNLKTLPFIFKERIDNMVPEYPANSNKSKEEAKQPLKPVVDQPAKVRKKKENKLLRLVFAQDFKDIEQGLFEGFIEPKIKDLSWSLIQAAIDTVMNAFRMMVYKDYKPAPTTKLPANTYTYNNYYSSSAAAYNNKPAPSMASELSYDEFTYPTRGDAEAVLTELKNQIVRCRCATVLDLYNLSNVTTTNYTLQDWGWTDLGFAEVRQTLSDDHQIVYMIAMPKAKPLQR